MDDEVDQKLKQKIKDKNKWLDDEDEDLENKKIYEVIITNKEQLWDIFTSENINIQIVDKLFNNFKIFYTKENEEEEVEIEEVRKAQEKIKEKEKVKCEICNCMINKSSFKRHEKSKKHIKNQNNLS